MCSTAKSQVFKLDEDLNRVRMSCDESSQYLGLAYQLLVTSKNLLVCSKDKCNICIFDLELTLLFNINLKFIPLGITVLNNNTYFVSAKGKIGVMDIDIQEQECKISKIIIQKGMKVNDDVEVFNKESEFRGICTSNKCLLVTEVNKTDSNYRRLLYLEFIGNQLKRVAVEKDFSKHCSEVCNKEKCSPVVVAHCNGVDYFSQGYFNGKFHVVRVTLTKKHIMQTKKLFDCGI